MNFQIVRSMIDLRHLLWIYLPKATRGKVSMWIRMNLRLRHRGPGRHLRPPPERETPVAKVRCALATDVAGFKSQCFALCNLCLKLTA